MVAPAGTLSGSTVAQPRATRESTKPSARLSREGRPRAGIDGTPATYAPGAVLETATDVGNCWCALLPGTTADRPLFIGLRIWAEPRTRTFFYPVVERLLSDARLSYRLVTENGAGEWMQLPLAPLLEIHRFADAICDHLS